MSEKDLLAYTPTPIQEIHDQKLIKAGVRLIVKREDLNHPFVSGNKWWKLKYNLAEARRHNKKTLLTFGGAFSNHIYATAAAAHELGFQCIGIIRGEKTIPLNPTLSFANERGMSIHYVTRDDYRKKADPVFIDELQRRFGDFYLIPEGGTNALAVKGCIEFAETLSSLDFDYMCLPVGTGGTMAGIIEGLHGKKQIVGISVLKGDFLTSEIQNLLDEKKSQPVYGNWSLLTSYHHGGYAKVTAELVEFMRGMRAEHNLPLDPVYTGKLLWAVMEEVKKGSFARGSTILALHTGGLQGAIANHDLYEENST